ncbi:hypothetical protein AAG906_004006 [Vitis piasezkii]
MARRFGGSNPRRSCASQTRTTSEPDTYYARTTDEPNRHRTRTMGKPNRHRRRAVRAPGIWKALTAPRGHHGTTLGVPRTHRWHLSTHTWLVGACCWFRWQLASGSKSMIRIVVSYKGLADGCELMVGAKRHLGLKKCLQLGGYTSSSPGWLCLSFKNESPGSLRQSMRAWDSYGEDIAVLKKTVLQGCSSGLEAPPKARVLELKGFNGNRMRRSWRISYGTWSSSSRLLMFLMARKCPSPVCI